MPRTKKLRDAIAELTPKTAPLHEEEFDPRQETPGSWERRPEVEHVVQIRWNSEITHGRRTVRYTPYLSREITAKFGGEERCRQLLAAQGIVSVITSLDEVIVEIPTPRTSSFAEDIPTYGFLSEAIGVFTELAKLIDDFTKGDDEAD